MDGACEGKASPRRRVGGGSRQAAAMESRGRVLLPLLPLLVAVLVLPLVLGLEHTRTVRLTTFGTQNKATPKPNHGQTVKGPECTKETDCNRIRDTMCRKDPRDSKLRCLCADKTTPTNGACKYIALHKECKKEGDCMPGAECIHPMMNSTNSNSSASPSHSGNTKTCQCKEGFVEESEECDSGFKTTIPSIYEILVITIGSILLVVH